jgi:hypothetical protein
MINFFRKIRRKLADDNQLLKYSRYAVGEILLVMVGILLALQVNNWNEERKKVKTTIIAFQELINNVKLDLDDLKRNVKSDSSTQSSVSHVLKIIENKTPYDSTMSIHFGGMTKYSNFFHHKSAFENLRSTGFDLVKNESLRFAIIKYYDETCNYLLKLENNPINPHELNFVQPFMMEHFYFSSFFEPAYPIDYNNLLKQEKLISILSTKHRLFDWKRKRSLDVINEGEKLIALIQEELIVLKN